MEFKNYQTIIKNTKHLTSNQLLKILLNEFQEYVHSELKNIDKKLEFSYDSLFDAIIIGVPKYTDRQVMTILVDDEKITVNKNYGQILYPKLVELIQSKML